jgi:hypothetical protein
MLLLNLPIVGDCDPLGYDAVNFGSQVPGKQSHLDDEDSKATPKRILSYMASHPKILCSSYSKLREPQIQLIEHRV